jgi:hypothetical protein
VPQHAAADRPRRSPDRYVVGGSGATSGSKPSASRAASWPRGAARVGVQAGDARTSVVRGSRSGRPSTVRPASTRSSSASSGAPR